MGGGRMQTHVDQLVKWLQEQVESAGMKGLIVGLSGGLDSSVVAYLIKKAFPNDSLSVILPCKSGATDESDAMKVVKACGIKNVTVDVTEAHDAIFSRVEKEIQGLGDWQEEKRRLGDANLHHPRHAGEVLHQHTRRAVADFAIGAPLLLPVHQCLQVLSGHTLIIGK
ncbi:MAG TPA: NAD(+) synthase, partial [Massilibacterium sp.]|nr:NAD(+) synthase [Massilibacterium sp.]